MSEHTTQTVKAQIQSLINLANETTGNQATNLTDGVNALVSGYGQGGSGGASGGLENGINVSFYDLDGNLFEVDSVSPNGYVTKPYVDYNFKDANGFPIAFPFQPAEDVLAYGFSDKLSAILQQSFGVDTIEYPHVTLYIAHNKWVSTCLYFHKTYGGSTGDTGMTVWYAKRLVVDFTVADLYSMPIEEAVSYLCANYSLSDFADVNSVSHTSTNGGGYYTTVDNGFVGWTLF